MCLVLELSRWIKRCTQPGATFFILRVAMGKETYIFYGIQYDVDPCKDILGSPSLSWTQGFHADRRPSHILLNAALREFYLSVRNTPHVINFANVFAYVDMQASLWLMLFKPKKQNLPICHHVIREVQFLVWKFSFVWSFVNIRKIP